ncbi:MAG: Ig-like domain-containing protein [Spirochaetota bacterium]|nr:Ig-like domain-containing protein [Spirochaetota bacterium]
MKKSNLYLFFTVLLTFCLFCACSKGGSNSSDLPLIVTNDPSTTNPENTNIDAGNHGDSDLDTTEPEDTNTEALNPDSIDSDTTAPVAVFSPGNGLTIGPDQEIIISFNETIDMDSLVLDGTFVPECDGGVWSNSTVPNDTLTIYPDFGWTTGTDKTLTIDCKDTSGNNLSTLSLIYDVDADIPSFDALPVNSSTISDNQVLVITFSESMDTATLSYVGSMAVESNGGVWSTSTYDNDTLTVRPALASTWTGGEQTLEIDCDDVYGNSLPTINLSYTVDITPPTYSETPVIGSTIDVNQIIEIVFNESIDRSSLGLEGDLSGESDGGYWSTTAVEDDTLTISPNTLWTGGAARTLTIDCDDLFGNSLSTVPLTYDVDAKGPSATTFPAKKDLTLTDPVIFTFDEAIDISSVVLSGQMADDCDGGVWSTTTFTYDTLTLYPITEWDTTAPLRMNIDCTDMYGNTAVPQIKGMWQIK